MASPRARVASFLFSILAASLLLATPARAATNLRIVVTDDEWHRFADVHPGAFGLGVYPDSRDPHRFIEEIGNGAPLARPGARTPVRGRRGALTDALAQAGVGIDIRDETGVLPSALRRAFAGSPGGQGPRLFVEAVFGVGIADLGPFDGPTILIGLTDKTPVWIEVCSEPRCIGQAPGILSGGIARRPGIVTPYDIAATILDHFDVERSETFIGNPLHSVRDKRPLERLRTLARNLDLSSGLGATMGATATVTAIAFLALGLLFVWRGRRDLAVRAGQGAALAAAGYMVALFVPTASGTLRALVIGAGIAVGAAIPPRDTRAFARITLTLTAIFATLVVVAPLRPGGLPGTALWGNPLKSWRFFGLQNFEVSFIAVNVVVWGVLARIRPAAFAVLCGAATIIVGAPRVGSNFVGVLTIAFGASLAALALVRRRIELWQAFAAVAMASAAFVLALLADAGSPVSHGGRAAKRISEGGFSTLVDFVEARLRLNVDLIDGFPFGWLLMAMMLAVAGGLLYWAVRSRVASHARIAVWAGAAMALSCLVLEDSGFYAGPIILVTAGAAWMITSAGGESTASS